MKVAILHDFFTSVGGGEKVVIALAKRYDADIYTYFWDKTKTFDEIKNFRVYTSNLKIKTNFLKQVGAARFFETLNGKGNLINRLYLGVETAHTEGSYLLNKRINYWQKLTATKLIQDSGIRLKVIVQLGVLGKGFYPLGKEITPENFVTWEEATDITAGWINEVQPYRVLESVYQPSPELPINRLIKDGRIVPYDNPEQIEQERKRLRENIRIFKNEFKVEPRYEDFLPKKGGQVIEYRKK